MAYKRGHNSPFDTITLFFTARVGTIAMLQLRIVAVGRIKTAFWQEAIEHYTKRISFSLELATGIAKDADAHLPLPKRISLEAERLEKFFLPTDTIISLDEKGKNYTSTSFTRLLEGIWESARQPCFVIGGAYGLADSIKQKARHSIALGSITLPHELARVVLYEQIYRATTIMAGTGYHH